MTMLPVTILNYCKNVLAAGELPGQNWLKFSKLSESLHKPSTDAAVLIPLIPLASEILVLFTQRSGNLPYHPNQISFPGGKQDDGDATLSATALRENEEELGIPRSTVEVIGELPFHHTFSGFMIKPIVGWIVEPILLNINLQEVVGTFTVPLSFLLASNNYSEQSRIVDGYARTYLSIKYQNWQIWGATAAIVWTLRDKLLEEAKKHG